MPMRTRRAAVPFASWFGAAGPVVVVGLTVGLLGGLSCKTTIANLDHCYYQLGNETCATRYDDLPYCATTCAGKDGNAGSPHDDGCVDLPPEPGCYSPCGGENDVADDATCLDVADTGSTSMTATTTTNDPTSETSDTAMPECTSSDECMDADAPICVGEECRPCGDADLPDGECALRDPAMPVCSDSGACVQCTADNIGACGGTTPVCNASSACIPCTEHDDCTHACEIATGACFPDDCVRDVPDEHSTIQAALDAVEDEDFCVIRVLDDVNGSIVLEGASPRAIVYFGGGSSFSLHGSTDQPTLLVSDSSVAYIEGLRFDLNELGAITATGTSTLYLDSVEVVGNPGYGVRVLLGSYMRMRNSIVSGNGVGADDTPGVRVSNSDAEILYSTIVDNDGSEVDTLYCVNADVTVRNSILMGNEEQSIGCDAMITFSAVDENVAGSGNVDLSPLSLAWFAEPTGLNYHLSESGVEAFADIARWIDGDPPDPPDDIDGNNRVAMDGASEPAGADVPN